MHARETGRVRSMQACDDISRRTFLTLGAMGGLSLAGFLRQQARGEIAGQRPAEAAIYVFLGGGPSHLDTFDPKPRAAVEYRGEFGAIDTRTPGMQLCEHLPRLASTSDLYTLVRGVAHNLGDHGLGTQYVNTGNRPSRQFMHPGIGSIILQSRGARVADLPPFIAVPDTMQQGGLLGIRYSPLATRTTPQIGRPFAIRGMALEKGQNAAAIEKREQLRRDLDRGLSPLAGDDSLLQGLDEFSDRAFDVISSPKTRLAIDLSRESPAFSTPFGNSSFGASLLMALRLVEAGVRFVTVSQGGWDTHQANFSTLRNRLPAVDQGLAGLLGGLKDRGLLDSTLVVVTGEFGRSPRVNENAGRGHHPQAMFTVIAGAGIPGGRTLGATDDTGAAPVDFECSPADVAASVLQAVGVNPSQEYRASNGRPMRYIAEGKVIRGLFG